MPLSSDEESCSVFSKRQQQSTTTSTQSTLGEAEEKYLECPVIAWVAGQSRSIRGLIDHAVAGGGGTVYHSGVQ